MIWKWFQSLQLLLVSPLFFHYYYYYHHHHHHHNVTSYLWRTIMFLQWRIIVCPSRVSFTECSTGLFLAQQPPVGQGLLIHEVSRSHTTTHHRRLDSSGRVISLSHRTLTTHNIHNRQTSMPPAVFEPTIRASERSQTYALDREASGIDICTFAAWYKITVFIIYFTVSLFFKARDLKYTS